MTLNIGQRAEVLGSESTHVSGSDMTYGIYDDCAQRKGEHPIMSALGKDPFPCSESRSELIVYVDVGLTLALLVDYRNPHPGC